MTSISEPTSFNFGQPPATTSPTTDTTDQTDQQTEPRVLEFDDMGLHDDLLRGVYGLGFEHPSDVQQRAIMLAASGRDIIIQAQSGTGKTGTFSIATLQQLDPTLRQVQAIVLSPTRELAAQTRDVMQELGMYRGLESLLTIGGQGMRTDIDALRSGRIHVVCGTPGRLEDHLRAGRINAATVRVLVLDEADAMLEKNFLDQIRDILGLLPQDMQIMVVSATLSPAVLELTHNFLAADHHRVLVRKEELTLKGLSQFYVNCEEARFKFDVLLDLYEVLSLQQSVIFCNTRRRVQEVAEYLRARDFPVSEIHSDMDQHERMSILCAFRRGESRVLVATDIIARGIDVQQISVVVNFELPPDHAFYIHRIGRSARHGRRGVAINLIAGRDVDTIADLEQLYVTDIKEMPDPVALRGLM
jgi:superfamily II DNA/RNA helicase